MPREVRCHTCKNERPGEPQCKEGRSQPRCKGCKVYEKRVNKD